MNLLNLQLAPANRHAQARQGVQRVYEKNKRFFLILFLSLLTITSFSQKTATSFSGIILSDEQKVPIPYAHVSIQGSNIGTASDEEGKFRLLVPSSFEVVIKISCIGYAPVLLSLDTIDTSKQLKVFLKSSIMKLDEVKITETSISPDTLIKQSIQSRKTHIYTDPYFAEYYSIVLVEDSLSGYLYNLETVFRDYFINGAHTYIYTEQRSTGTFYKKNDKCSLPAHFEIHETNGHFKGLHQIGIFNLDNLSQFNLEYSGIIPYNDDTVYVIEYEAKNPSRELTGYGDNPYYGTLYIDVVSNAILKHSWTIKFNVTQGIQYEILYKKVKDYFFPYYLKSSRTLFVKKKFQPILTNTIILRNIEFTDVDISSSNDNCNPPPFNKNFWDFEYPE